MSECVRNYYDGCPEREWERLDAARARVEFASTLRLIDKYFPNGGRVCDIGSGPGRYAIELARRGYQVALFDLSEKLLEHAMAVFEAEGLHADGFVCGDARDMRVFDDGQFDAALFLGPCYHLIGREGRVQALRELHRLLRPDGMAIVAYLNSWGLIRTGVIDFPQRYRKIAFLREMLGERVWPDGIEGFTECYWSTPRVAIGEVEEAGFAVISYAGAESFLAGVRGTLDDLAEREPEAYTNLIQAAEEMAELPQYRDATDHLHIVVQKPTCPDAEA